VSNKVSHRQRLAERLAWIDAEKKRLTAHLANEEKELLELLVGSPRVNKRAKNAASRLRALFDDGQPHNLTEAMRAAGYSEGSVQNGRWPTKKWLGLVEVEHGVYKKPDGGWPKRRGHSLATALTADLPVVAPVPNAGEAPR
jgi:hypothetical protein